MAQQLAQHLIERGLLPARIVEEAVRRAEREGGALDTALLELGAASEAGILQALADVSGLRLVNLADFEPNLEAAPLMPFKVARRLNCVPLSLDGANLHVACASPLAPSEIKEVGFLLGRKVELWVALECRVHDWQATLYGTLLEPRDAALLALLDPRRKKKIARQSGPELGDEEVADRISQTLVDEPVLLVKPKHKGASTPPMAIAALPLGEEFEETTTSVIDATAYERFAKSTYGEDALSTSSDSEPTRVMDLGGYADFAREITKEPAPVAPPPISFPGGVLPPRRSPSVPPPPRRITGEWVQPASAPRPASPSALSRADPPAPLLTQPGPPAPASSQPAPQTPRPAIRISESAVRSGVLLAQPPGLEASNAAEWSLAEARASLKPVSQDREALVRVILEYGRRAFEYVAAFAVMRGAAVGWEARGEGDVSAITQVAIPLDVACVLRTVALTRGSYVGPLPADALSQHYLALLGRTPRTVFLWPIEVQSRLVAILYGDCGARPVSQRRLADYILFCQDLPAAFHELILFRKQNPKAAQTLAATTTLPPKEMLAPPLQGTQGGPGESSDDEWIEGVIKLLTGPEPSERSMAMLELKRTPQASAKALCRVFPGPTAWSRLPVAELPECDDLGPVPGALCRLGQPGAAALAPLLDAPDSDTRYLALLTAGSLPFPEVVDGVLRGLFDFEPDISSAARSAAAALRSLPSLRARLPALRAELKSPDPVRRSLAARALGVLRDRDSAEALIALTGSGDDLCAQSAADALRELTCTSFGTDRAAWTAWWNKAKHLRRLDWLVASLEADDFDLRLAAIEALSHAFGDNHGFFADGEGADRAQAVARWRAIIASQPNLDV